MNIHLDKPEGPVSCRIALAGSKSISNRALVIRALSGLQFELQNLSDAEDTRLLEKALQQVQQGTDRYIDVNHAGTDFRFLTALLAITPGEWTLTGSARMKQRPIAELVNALRELGAEIDYLDAEGFPPLRIRGKKLRGGSVSIRGDVSSQYISALLLIAPALEQGLDLHIQTPLVSRPYMNMTIALMREFDMTVIEQDGTVYVKPGRYAYGKDSYLIEGDWSSASYWYSLAAIAPEADIVLDNLFRHSTQADSIAKTIYEDFGVSSQEENNGQSLRLVKNDCASGGSFHFDFLNSPDIAQTLACTCAALKRKAELTGLQTLRIKETDRITALEKELGKLGAAVACTNDALSLKGFGKPETTPVFIQTYHDHRMAMSFAALCLTDGSIVIEDKLVVEKSYPGFWDDLRKAGFRIGEKA